MLLLQFCIHRMNMCCFDLPFLPFCAHMCLDIKPLLSQGWYVNVKVLPKPQGLKMQNHFSGYA